MVGAELCGWFNDRVCGDLFFLGGKPWMLLIDTAIRWKTVVACETKGRHNLAYAVFLDWMRFSGPVEEFDATRKEASLQNSLAICVTYSVSSQS